MAAGTKLGTAYVQIRPSADGIKGSISNVLGGEASSAGTSAGLKIGAFAKKAIAAAGIGTTIVGVIKGAVSEGAKLQQSYMGGIDTLYGDAADGMRAYAREAAKAGISMNDFSEQAVSFGAALKSAYGGDTQKAMEAANTAILDMTDNAAKMGTPLESIQNAYQGFAKQNYTMLDNLKLGYGGTKSEMERLLADAQKLTGVKYDIGNLGDVYDAIHAIQGNLGLTGVAAKEASETFSGSFGAMKASAQNLLGSLALGEGIQPAFSDLLTATDTFIFNNLIPMLGTIIKGFPEVIAAFVKEGIPRLLNHISTFIANIAATLTTKANSLTSEKVQAWAVTTIPKLLKSAGDLIGKFAGGLIQNLPKIVGAIGRIGMAIVTGLGSALWGRVKEAVNGIKDRVLGVFASIKESITNIVSTIADKVSSIWTGLKDTVGGIFDAIWTKASTVWEGIKSAITNPIQTAMEFVRNAIQSIKDFISGLSFQLPHINLPHFRVYGGRAPWGIGGFGEKPSIDIEWYAKGGIADKPIIGMGEAGPEAIVPLDPFWKKLDQMAESTGNEVIINVYPSSGMDEKAIAEAVERRFIDAQKRRRLAWG